jgi:hypothetical protein
MELDKLQESILSRLIKMTCLNNLLFEKLYNKSKELGIDLIFFNHFSSDSPNEFIPIFPSFPKNIIIRQPELRITFFVKSGENRLYNCIN